PALGAPAPGKDHPRPASSGPKVARLVMAGAAAGRIVFWASPDGSCEPSNIFSICTDGNRRRKMTGAHATEMDPAYSPDRRRIAFAVARSAESRRVDLFVMNSDGSNRQPLTHLRKGEAAIAPAWSPDGRQIAFTLLRDEPNDEPMSTWIEVL